MAKRHPNVFALLLKLPANTPIAREVREGVYVWLRQAGVAEENIPSAERLLSTLILGYAVSEATGRFDDHSQAEIDSDYVCIEAVIEQTLRELRQKA